MSGKICTLDKRERNEREKEKTWEESEKEGRKRYVKDENGTGRIRKRGMENEE